VKKYYCAARSLTTHWTRADGACLSFARLKASLNSSRPVNSGVRHASRKQKSRASFAEAQNTKCGELNNEITGRSINSLEMTAR